MAVSGSSLVRLLDVEPELASRLREDDRAEARQRLLATTYEVPEGADATAFEETFGRAFGVMVVDGIVLQEVALGARQSLQLLGPGDVLAPHGPASTLTPGPRWTAAVPTTVAVLDDRLQAPLALWPGLALGLVDRVAQQVERGALLAAILQLPRVEDRLEATFWTLADRWGRVTPAGIQLPLRLTHEMLARLVGGRRPTISLALTTLADRGVLVRHADGSWLIVGERPSAVLRAPDLEAPRGRGVALTPLPALPVHEPWQPHARRELLAVTHRAADEHAVATRRVVSGRERLEETRTRSRILREQVATQRAARQAVRDAHAPPPLSRPRPAAPSAG